jgi:hypothetical protein
LRPAEFSDANVFDERLRGHIAIHEAELQLRQQTPDGLAADRALMQSVFGDAEDETAAGLLLSDLAGDPPVDGPGWVEHERRVPGFLLAPKGARFPKQKPGFNFTQGSSSPPRHARR